MEDVKQKVSALKGEFLKIKDSLDLEKKREQLGKLEAESTDPDFWDNQQHARRVMQTLGDLKNEIEAVEKLSQDIDDLQSLTADASFAGEVGKELKRIEKDVDAFKSKTYLKGEYADKDAIVAIHAGQGGTEAMDWASMLYRMYLRYCEIKGWSVETLELSESEEAGIKSVTFSVTGDHVYGYLKGEAGTHRLVRQSPFNADRLRQTSFALVGVLPRLAEVDLPDIKIKDEDLDWQFFRASTQGGQNVQKVSTAVRLTHLPSGVVVTSQTQRYQEQNRKIALDLLRVKLWALKKDEVKNEVKKIRGDYKPASWGYQIRSYVLHPYKMVKDLRTGVETGDTDAVLDGQLDEFIEAELRMNSD